MISASDCNVNFLPKTHRSDIQEAHFVSFPIGAAWAAGSFLGLEGGVDLGKRELRTLLFVELATWVYPNTISFHTGPGGYARSNAS